MVGWALLADTVPIYPLYALLFEESGLSSAEISALFAVWSATAIVAEVPSGALADRFGRRNALVAAGVLQAAGYVLWIATPGFAGFAAGFVLWGLGGALISGAQEALLYDGLAAADAAAEYPRTSGWVTSAMLIAQFPAAAAATVLFAVGGYPLAGWVSVGVCLVSAVAASRLPEPPQAADEDDGHKELGYLATLRAGVAEAAARPGVRAAVVAAALVGGFDALEEYFPLVTEGLGVPIPLVPLAMLPIALAGALGAAAAGRAAVLRPVALGLVLGAAMVLMGAAGLFEGPFGIAAVAVSYGVYHTVLVIVDARLQERIESRSRATVTSVAGLGLEAVTFVVYAAWAIGELSAIAVFGLLIAIALPFLLGRRAVKGPSGGG